MSSHHGKLLELLAIEDTSNYPFLRIKLSLSEDTEILWKIDEYTADSLRLIAKFDEKYKYRLSFNSSWNNIKQQHLSTLTRTYLNTSERVLFLCSEDYATQLSSIKHSHGIHDLDMQDFTPLPLETILPHKRSQSGIVLIYISFLLMCFLLGTLLGYSGLACLSNPTFNKQAASEHFSIP